MNISFFNFPHKELSNHRPFAVTQIQSLPLYQKCPEMCDAELQRHIFDGMARRVGVWGIRGTVTISGKRLDAQWLIYALCILCRYALCTGIRLGNVFI